MKRSEMVEFVEALGLNPHDLASVTLDSAGYTAAVFVRDEYGSRTTDEPGLVTVDIRGLWA